MKTKYYGAKVETKDVKSGKSRRFRNILANSGEIMESGEIREIEDLYVMGYDGELYKISDLATDPEKQTEKYAVKAQADHGELIDGELVPSIEKQFGSCKVWLEDDGLHARMYFADDDKLADHAWAISEDASYSTGIDWFPDGYYGTGYEITEPIGILREISMVLTGNDPRAKTIDAKKDGADGADTAAKSEDSVTNQIKKGNEKMTKKLDELTPDEGRAMAERILNVVDEFTTDAPESETEPTARDTKDTEGEATEAGEKAEAPAEKTNDNVKHMPVVVIKDRAVKQEKAMRTNDWRLTTEAKRRFADLAYKNQGFKGSFDSLWNAELEKHNATTNDGITGLGLPVDGRQIIVDALEKSDGIINHFDFIGGTTYLVKLISAAEGNNAESARAGGHLKGDTKLFQQLKSDPRQFYNVPVYKKLDIDYLELYENPELIDVRARELVEARIVEIERAMVIGDGRVAPQEGSNTPDRRMFRGGRGFYSMVADATTSGVGQLFSTALTIPAGANMVDASILAENELRAEGERIMVAKKSRVTNARLARLGENNTGDYLIPRGTSVEDAFGVGRIYTPAWMEYADCDFVIFVNNTPKLIGKAPAAPDMKAFFDTTNDTDVLMAEGPNGGGLAAYKAAVVATFTDESE